MRPPALLLFLASLAVGSVWAGPAEAADDAVVRRADLLLRSGDVAEALGVLRTHLADDPDDVAAREMLSDVLVSTGNGSQALASAQAMVAVDADSADAWYLLGRATPDPEAALQAYQEALNRDAEHGRSWMGIAAVRRVEKDYEAAASAYDKALGFDKELAEAWNGLISVRADLGDKDGAVDAAARAVENVPWDPKVWVTHAILEPARAQDILRTGVSTHPEDLSLRYAYARSLVDSKNYREARRQYEAAAEIAPTMAELWVEHGLAGEVMTEALSDQGARRLLRLRDKAQVDPGAALNELDELAEENPRSGWVLLVRGNVRHAMRAYMLAEGDLRAAFERMPTSPEAQSALGVLLLGTERAEWARPLLAAASKARPHDDSLMVAAAMAAAEAGDHDTATTELEAAWKRFPTSPGPPLGLGRVKLAQEDPDGAYAVLAKAVRERPSGALVVALSAAALEAGRPEEAAVLLDSLASVTGDDTFAQAAQVLRDEAKKLEEEAKVEEAPEESSP